MAWISSITSRLENSCTSGSPSISLVEFGFTENALLTWHDTMNEHSKTCTFHVQLTVNWKLFDAEGDTRMPNYAVLERSLLIRCVTFELRLKTDWSLPKEIERNEQICGHKKETN